MCKHPIIQEKSVQEKPNKKKWSNLMPLVVILVVIMEIAFLGRLDMAKNAAMFKTWASTFHFDSLRGVSSFLSQEDGFEAMDVETNTNNSSTEKRTSASSDSGESGGGENCEVWLENQDAVSYSRNFQKDPILVSGVKEEWNSCAVGCKFGSSDKKVDAAFGVPHDGLREGVLQGYIFSSRF